jgi:site-specific DNA-cytosine methylase
MTPHDLTDEARQRTAKSRRDWLHFKQDCPEKYAEYLQKRRQARSGNPDYLRRRREAKARLKLEQPEKYAEMLRKSAEGAKARRRDPNWRPPRNSERRREYLRNWMKAWRGKNAETQKEYLREYRRKNKARIAEQIKRSKSKKADKYRAIRLAACRKWRAGNVEAAREACRDYCKRHPEVYRALAHARRTRKTKAGGRYTAAEILEMLLSQKGRCANPKCPREITLRTCHRDHKTPVKLGGSSAISNIQLLCRDCNISKKDKPYAQWCAEVGIVAV